MIHPTTLLMLAMSDHTELDRRAHRAVEVREALERGRVPGRHDASLVSRLRAALAGAPAAQAPAPTVTCRADGAC